jgi:hypothetical protein
MVNSIPSAKVHAEHKYDLYNMSVLAYMYLHVYILDGLRITYTSRPA